VTEFDEINVRRINVVEEDGKPRLILASRDHFDQYQQDNTLRLIYRDKNGDRQAGLSIMDRPDSSIVDALELYDKVQLAETDAERARFQAELDAIAESYEKSVAERFFTGKESGDSVVRLADKQGRPRLVLRVDAGGEPSVELLDAAGQVVHRIP
jgi:hypothetical protein